ncbi:sensor histidine kinase [Alkalihalobacillus sp. FSL W8-0930]
MDLFKRYKIRHILFGSITTFTLLLLLTIIAVTYQLTTEENTKKTISHQVEKLTLLSRELSSELSSFQETSIGLSRQKAFQELMRQSREMDSDSSSALSRQRTLVDLDFSNVIYSVPGLHSISIYMDHPPVNSQHPVQFQTMEMFRSFPGANELADVTAAWLGERKVNLLFGEEDVVSYGRNVYSSRGDLIGVLVLNIQKDFIEDWLRDKGDTSNLFVLDGDGSLLSHPPDHDEFLEFQPYLKQLSSILQNRRGVTEQAELTSDGDLVVSSAVPSSNWTLMEVTPKDLITAGSKKIAIWLSGIGLISIIFVTITMLYLTKKFTEPIIQLKDVMQTYPQSSSATHELPNDYQNEFGYLFDGYLQLVERSDSLYASVLQKTKRQRIAESKALQANINPHFLYNTLDQLNWRAIERGDDDMSKMLELLGNMLRIGLSKGISHLSIPEELDYLKHYLELQKINRDGKLDYQIRTSGDLSSYYLPKLTLQPFVENAVIHGLTNKNDGFIQVTIEEKSQSLLIDISDNGRGLSRNQNERTSFDTGGYGIANVKERLAVYFGDKASITLENNQIEGVTAKVIIPKVDAHFFHLLNQDEEGAT